MFFHIQLDSETADSYQATLRARQHPNMQSWVMLLLSSSSVSQTLTPVQSGFPAVFLSTLPPLPSTFLLFMGAFWWKGIDNSL